MRTLHHAQHLVRFERTWYHNECPRFARQALLLIDNQRAYSQVGEEARRHQARWACTNDQDIRIHAFPLDPRIPGQPARNRAQVGLIALTKPATQRGFLVEDDKQMHHDSHQQPTLGQEQRVKEDGLTEKNRKDTKIHRITHPPIGSRSHQEDRRVDGRWRPTAYKGERSGTPEVEDYSYEEREQTNQLDREGRHHRLS